MAVEASDDWLIILVASDSLTVDWAGKTVFVSVDLAFSGWLISGLLPSDWLL